MSRPRKADPKYRRHRPSGQAVVTLSDAAGRRRDVYLGEYRSETSKREYARILNEWHVAQERPQAAKDLTINELILAFLRHADAFYGPGATEPREYRRSAVPLRKLYGHTLAGDFGPLALKGVRQALIGAGFCRNTVNARVARIKRLFKWGVSEELVAPSVFHGLQAVTGLARGRSTAPESMPVKPVPEAHVDAVLPHVLPEVADMIELQRLTAMRPGEIIAMRAMDIDTTGDLWLYQPPQHKTAWRGKAKVIPLGPRAREIVRRHFTTDLTAYLFSPVKAMEGRAARLRIARKSPVQPSQVNRRKANPKRRPRDHYDVCGYDRAITRGIELANAATHRKAAEEGRDAAEHELIPHWHPNQLRHSRATEVRRKYGLEAAQCVLGHATAHVTEIYAERNLGTAMKVAAECG